MTAAPLNVLIAVPSHGACPAAFAFCLARAMAFFATLPYEGEKSVDVIFVQGSILPDVRTRLVAKAYDRKTTHLLWLDSDMTFPPDIIPRLLNHNKPVVACNYPQKTIEARPTAYVESDEYTGPLWTREGDTGLVEVSYAGMGVMLTDMRVFDALDMPIFLFEAAAPNFVVQNGEDVYFCRKLREKDIPVYVDQDASQWIGHVGEFEYTSVLSNAAEDTKQILYKALPK